MFSLLANTLKKIKLFSIKSIILVLGLLLYINPANTQNLELIPNPPNHTNNGYFDTPVEFNGKLYLKYRNSDGVDQLYRFNGNSLTLIPNPPNHTNSFSGYQGIPYEYNGELFLLYRDNLDVRQLYKYDGTTLSLIPNPSNHTNSQSGYFGNPYEYNGELFLQYRDNSDVYQLYKYNGTSLTLVPNPPNHTSNLRGYTGFPFKFNGELFLRYGNNDGVNQLYKYNGSSLTLIPNPPNHSNSSRGYFGIPFEFDGELFLRYRNNADVYQLYKYNGSSLTLIPNPSNSFSYTGNPIEYNGELFFRCRNNSNSVDYLCKYDGNSLILIPNPPNFTNLLTGYQGDPIEYNGELFLRFINDNYSSRLYKFDGSSLVLISNPPNGFSYSGAPIVYNDELFLRYTNSNTELSKLYRYDGAELNLISNPPNHTINIPGFTFASGYQGKPYEYSGLLYLQYRNSDLLRQMYRYLPLFEWTGNEDNSWNNANNWNPFSVPVSNANVTIPTNPTGGNFPEIEMDAEVNDITIENDATLDILSGHSLTVNGVLDNEGVVTVESDGALVQITGSTLAGNGTFNVERTLGAVNPWYIGSPISNAGVGSFGITPSGIDGEQFDPGPTCEPSDVDVAFEGLMELREDADVSSFGDCSHGLWHTKSAGTLENGRGYAAYAPGGSTLTFSGTVNNDFVSLSGLTSTAGTVNVPSPINTTIGRGWHLVSNPYPSPITIGGGELQFNMGLDQQTHRWNSATGQWISQLGGTFAVGQAFQVRNSSEGSLTGFQVNNNMRVVSAEPFYKSNTSNFEEYLTITLSNNEHENVSYIYFKEDATDGYDKSYDVNRLFGLAEVPLVYCPIEDNEILAYNALPKLEADVQKSVPLAIYEGAGGAMTLTFTELSTLQTDLQDVTVVLEDTKLDEMTQLTEGLTYDFEVSEGDARERFVVHFYPVAKEIEQEEELEEEEEEVLSINDLQNQVIGLFPNPTEFKATLMLDVNHTFTNVQVVSITGKVINTYVVAHGQTNVNIDLSGMSAGVYLVQVKGAHGQTVRKLVKQ